LIFDIRPDHLAQSLNQSGAVRFDCDWEADLFQCQANALHARVSASSANDKFDFFTLILNICFIKKIKVMKKINVYLNYFM
jgi:hypothetical protein